MKRKIVKHGSSTLTVSLPSKWAKKFGIKEGIEVDVLEDKNSLRITTESFNDSKKIKIDLKDENKFALRSIFGGLYRAGYDEIEVTSKSYEPLLELQTMLDILPAFEYFEISKTKAIVKNISPNMNLSVTDGINKMKHIINTMHDILVESIENNKFEKLDEIQKLRDNAIKYRDFVSRIILKDNINDNLMSPYYIISFVLATIPGYYRTLYKKLSKDKQKISKESLILLTSIKSYFNDMVSRNKKASDLYYEWRNFEESVLTLLKKKEEDAFLISFSLSIFRQIQSMNSSYVMLGINI
ncbi:MAG: AbrB/MazE/SpoVT family DNA-binding domain-containing protein [Candidatus Woesearchaeota archaeon]